MQNSIELEDSIFGFFKIPHLDKFTEMTISKQESSYNDGRSNILTEFVVEVDGLAKKYGRNVSNFEDLFGMIGGFLSIIVAVLSFLLGPFTSDSLSLSLSKLTKSGTEINIDSQKFYWKRSIENLLMFEIFDLPIFQDEEYDK